MNEIKVGDYRIFTTGENNDEINVEFKDGNIITLASLQIEVVGLRPKSSDYWEVSLVTDIGLKKLKFGATETLELITFEVPEFKEAIALVSFLALKIPALAPAKVD